MRQVVRSIAYAAAFLVCCLANAEPASGPAPSLPAGAGFADSFGLNGAVHGPAMKPRAAEAQARPAWIPAADSFGLNDRLLSTLGECPPAPAEARPGAGSQKCLRM